MRNKREILREIESLTSVLYLSNLPRVQKVIEEIRKENAPKVQELREELEGVESFKKEPKLRWPIDTPPELLETSRLYWKGTTEFDKFRIHCWNEKAYWTSYPSGGYSVVGGWVPTPASFILVSRVETKQYDTTRGKTLKELKGRVSMKTMLEELQKI